MVKITILWCLLVSMAFSFGVDTEVVHLVNNNYEITGKIPRFTNTENKELPKALVDINHEIYSNFNEIKRMVISDSVQFSDDFPNSTLLPFTVNSSYIFTSNWDASIYSILIEISYYTGGAHPNYIYRGYTLDQYNNYTLDTFFINPKEAKRYITASIKKHITKSNEDAKSGKGDPKYFKAPTIDLKDSTFYIDKDELVILFPHYTLAPYSSGKLEFVFTLQELKPYLNKKWTDI